MKYILLFTCLLPCLGFNKTQFIDITNDFTINRFEAVKNFILKHGNTQTYRILTVIILITRQITLDLS